ncbi:HNH/ENDO VII family nuclease [Paenibacillus sp. RC67]|uniref:HNH/ENDO VII family nuclease n=1 Tax=Paenibacillus sp. RC67 TaxID=3039392 RepID=UPI0024AD3A08|nr:HNH/ENDO VII family nuclease [Paenibacillus sp. RC67]
MPVGEEIRRLKPQSESTSMNLEHENIEPNNPDAPEFDEATDFKGRVIEKPDIPFIENTSFSSLIEQNSMVETRPNDVVTKTDSLENERTGLSEEQKAEIREKTGWSDEIINSISSWKEYEIYQKAGLQESEVNGKKCLIRDDIDLDYEDEDGISNRERMKRGLSPITTNGEIVELHHIGQRADSPLAELSRSEHRGGGNDSILHDKTIATQVHGEGNNWSSEKTQYWKSRVSSIR